LKPTRKPTADQIRADAAKFVTLTMEERWNGIESGELSWVLPWELECCDKLAQTFADLSGKECTSDAFVEFLLTRDIPTPNRYTFPYVAAVLMWALEKSSYWPERLATPAAFCKNYDKIVRQYDKFCEKTGEHPHIAIVEMDLFSFPPRHDTTNAGQETARTA
jgi:hypothetical protein